MKEEIRKITKIARRSYGVVLPMKFVKELDWKERQKVKLTKRGAKIIVEQLDPRVE